jgi:hypothetical protein
MLVAYLSINVETEITVSDIQNSIVKLQTSGKSEGVTDPESERAA